MLPCKPRRKDDNLRRILIVLFTLLVITACSTTGDESEESASLEGEEIGEETEDKVNLEIETLFTYDHDVSINQGINIIQSDENGSAIVFTSYDTVDRGDDVFPHLLNHEGDVLNIKEFISDYDDEYRCTSTNLSPKGSYLLFDCIGASHDFALYDVNTGEMDEEIILSELIEEVEEYDLSIHEFYGISNDEVVYFQGYEDDSNKSLYAYDIKSAAMKKYTIDELFDGNSDSLDTAIPTNDGDFLLINGFTELHLFDTEKEESVLVIDVQSHVETFDTDIWFKDIKLSPEGTYAYYNIEESSTDPIVSEHVFHNLETDETTVFNEFDYSSVIGFDENGNVLLEESNELHIHNVDSGETRTLSKSELGSDVDQFTFPSKGKSLIYLDVSENEDETYTTKIQRVLLEDITSLESTELKASLDREETGEVEAQAGISLTENKFSEEADLLELWERSADIMYPTKFPASVLESEIETSGNPELIRYYYRVKLEDQTEGDITLTLGAFDHTEDGTCYLLEELEHAETIDSRDYYYYDFQNDDVAAGIAIDNFCYYLEAKNYSQDEMIAILQSFEPINEPVKELSINAKYPTKFPIEQPAINQPKVVFYGEGHEEAFDFQLNYDGSADDDILMKVDIRETKPNRYDNKNHIEVDVDGFDEAFYNEEYEQLFMSDGSYYYVVTLDIDNTLVHELGADYVQDVFVEIGNSFE